MDARCRQALFWSAGSFLAAPCLLACSLQNFDYLTKDRGVANSDAGTLDGAALSEASLGNDATSAVDATEGGEDIDARASSDASVDHADAGGDASTSTADAAEAGPTGPINYIVNPNFASSSLVGWTVVSITDAGTPPAFTQPPQGTATTPQGQAYELATYSGVSAFTVDVSQRPTNLPDGTYTFAGWFNRGPNNQAYIYAKNCGAIDATADGGAGQVADIPQTSASGWEQVTITGIAVTGGSCQVGLYVDGAPTTDWLNADGFSFEIDEPSGNDAGGLGDATTD